MKFRMSRWHYWWAYVLVFAFALFAMWASDRAFDVMAWVVGSLTLVFFLVCEMVVRWQRVELRKDGLIIKHGLFNPVVQRLSYGNFGKVDVRQSVLGQVFRVGDVIIHCPGRQNVGLVGMSWPGKLKKEIDKRLHASHKSHGHHVGGKK